MSDQSSKKLSRITIRGFKSIKNCDLELGDINVLIGSNGAGKSNFISVFELLQNILKERLSVYAGKKGVSSLFYDGIKSTDSIEMEFFFGQNSYSFTLILTESNSLIFKDEHFNWYNEKEGRWYPRKIASGHSESKWKQGPEKSTFNEYIQPILESQQWRVYHFHDTGPKAKMKQEHNISNSKNFDQEAGNLAAFLYRLKEHYYDDYKYILKVVQMIAPYFRDFELEPQEGNKESIILRWQQKDCDDVFNASQLSDGTLRFICLATLLLQPAKLQPATIIIDEPELGLHPFALTIFAEMVKKASVNSQIILSTQSAELLNYFDVEDIIVVDRGENGSEFKRLEMKQFKELECSRFCLVLSLSSQLINTSIS